jgi:hypothetical protein
LFEKREGVIQQTSEHISRNRPELKEHHTERADAQFVKRVVIKTKGNDVDWRKPENLIFLKMRFDKKSFREQILQSTFYPEISAFSAQPFQPVTKV